MCVKRNKKEKEKKAFSKSLLIQESILIWIITLAFIVLAFFCVFHVFDASFMWLTALPTVAWAAYGVSQAYYYKKSEKENTKNGIIYETAMLEAEEKFIDEIDVDDGK